MSRLILGFSFDFLEQTQSVTHEQFFHFVELNWIYIELTARTSNIFVSFGLDPSVYFDVLWCEVIAMSFLLFVRYHNSNMKSEYSRNHGDLLCSMQFGCCDSGWQTTWNIEEEVTRWAFVFHNIFLKRNATQSRIRKISHRHLEMGKLIRMQRECRPHVPIGTHWQTAALTWPCTSREDQNMSDDGSMPAHVEKHRPA